MAEAMGGNFAAGAAGGAAASLAMEAFGQALLDQKDLSESDRKALVQLAGAIVGGAAGGIAGGSVGDAAAGANVGKVATENNYLNHTQKRDRAEAMAACADKACRDKGFGSALSDAIRKTKELKHGQSVYEAKVKVGDYIKKGDFVYLDGKHGDHLEVYDSMKISKWVLNLDGSINEKKTMGARGRRLDK
ncbi:VENN motif pre-toxin domain-containing protein [Cupriavidus sp. SZY C1]|uniref:VENN motif pre-toxin domain-containing protein n=1 Tax=Cupriavidus sp. SZY C1 TaxID=3055037 RepID=UPI0028B4D38F|nr:VENN motif pre-toxin domain-containing protein [Cupriavidus sp. SZY C1]MDT6962373.1 VENN motif pre-toxin domain-containing protein [Cupriavidus sp. SZY C1]